MTAYVREEKVVVALTGKAKERVPWRWRKEIKHEEKRGTNKKESVRNERIPAAEGARGERGLGSPDSEGKVADVWTEGRLSFLVDWHHDEVSGERFLRAMNLSIARGL
ncbi:hypothetical protein R1sor_006076 [Riccia sorocarpa]|uniref:Uncharacterized protein n=1 Tax=Riccia sorocarpa TaxID=122646 RepID=A0ABD3HQ70_9MARC